MTTTTVLPTLSTPDGETISLRDASCIIVGYAGRDEDLVQAHIDELAAAGIAPPPAVPMFYEVPLELLSTDSSIRSNSTSSGEVEPVLVRHNGQLYLGVGSDHTDRELETVDVHQSKLACPKPMSATVHRFDIDDFDWDACTITMHLDGELYQSGTLAALRHPGNVLQLLSERKIIDAQQDFVAFGGTVPLLGGEFSYGSSWRCELGFADGTSLVHGYTTSFNPTPGETA